MTHSISHPIAKAQCPKCKRQGKDTSKDNLIEYSDGHHYCYACGYTIPANRLKTYQKKETIEVDNKVVRLPADIEPISRAPLAARMWLAQYDLTPNQITNNHIKWSQHRQRLIFPFFIDGTLVGWQGRWFGTDKAPKWYTDGKVDEFLYIRGAIDDTLVLTEDVISAIKVAPHCAASPIFGSVISTKRFRAIKLVAKNVIIWLDPDKQKEAIKFAEIGRLFGLNCKVIISTKDPKEHTNEELANYLRNATS